MKIYPPPLVFYKPQNITPFKDDSKAVGFLLETGFTLERNKRVISLETCRNSLQSLEASHDLEDMGLVLR